jgi:hypothetical protein
MATTPEGKVKKTVSALLKSVPGLFYTMPVPSGFGESTLDYIACYKGRFLAIETKKPGGKPTTRQAAIIEKMRQAGAKVLVIDGPNGLQELTEWIDALR